MKSPNLCRKIATKNRARSDLTSEEFVHALN